MIFKWSLRNHSFHSNEKSKQDDQLLFLSHIARLVYLHYYIFSSGIKKLSKWEFLPILEFPEFHVVVGVDCTLNDDRWSMSNEGRGRREKVFVTGVTWFPESQFCLCECWRYLIHKNVILTIVCFFILYVFCWLIDQSIWKIIVLD